LKQVDVYVFDKGLSFLIELEFLCYQTQKYMSGQLTAAWAELNRTQAFGLPHPARPTARSPEVSFSKSKRLFK
jgi:hypothetical protein